jgi:hypothetical protein
MAAPGLRPVPAAVAGSRDPQGGRVAATPVGAPRFGQATVSGIRVDFVAFDARSHVLLVADQAGGPGSEWADAAGAGRGAGALAAINAGFFTPEGKPLGLVIERGERRGALNRGSSLGAGMYVAGGGGGGRPALIRRELAGTRADATELLQAGPFLVENGAAVAGLDPRAARDRSFVAWDGGDGWLIGRTSACTLADLGTALASARPAGFPLRHALNLDGGSSADLWISGALTGGPATIRPFWNRPVRNFLLLQPR